MLSCSYWCFWCLLFFKTWIFLLLLNYSTRHLNVYLYKCIFPWSLTRRDNSWVATNSLRSVLPYKPSTRRVQKLACKAEERSILLGHQIHSLSQISHDTIYSAYPIWFLNSKSNISSLSTVKFSLIINVFMHVRCR